MFRLATCCVPWIVLMAVFAADARAQVSGANSKVITWQSPATATEIFVGILGEVRKPGVYRLEAETLTLHSVIRRAGGLTDEASLTIRIVRGERVVQSGFFSPNVDGPLQPGDLLVVESKRTQAAVSRTYESDPQIRAMYAAVPAGHSTPVAGVQLALLNVLDRPVFVLKKPEEANLLYLVQELGQPIELAQAARVISPDRLLSQATTHPVEAQISDCSVIVFPRSAVNRSKLPILPPAIESGIAKGAFPSLIGGRAGQSPELRNVGQLPLLEHQSPNSMTSNQPQPHFDQSSIPTPPASTNTLAPPSNAQRIELPAAPIETPVASRPSRIATVPFTGMPRVKSSSVTKSMESEPSLPDERVMGQDRADIDKPSTDQSRPHRKHRKTESDDALLLTTADDDSQDGRNSAADSTRSMSPVSLTSLFGVIGCVAVLIGIALMTRRILDGRRLSDKHLSHELIERGIETEMPAASNSIDVPIPLSPALEMDEFTNHFDQIPASAIGPIAVESQPVVAHSLASRLDRLIHNQLRIREERVEFSAQLVLQGRIVPPPVFRVDQAVANPAIEGPHFEIPALPSDEAPAKVATPSATKAMKEELDGSHPIGPSKPHFMKRRPGENTVAAAAASGTVTKKTPITAAEVKTSATPLTDALRQLQGGQS